MTLRDLLKKPFWSPKDLSLATGISLCTARERLSQIRKELEDQGYINLNNSKAPTKIIIERLNIDPDWLEKSGALDEILSDSKEYESL